MSHIELANSVTDVRRLLAECIETARAENSADGYFPLLYAWETQDLTAAADDGVFEEPEVLRRMVVVFANRYFSARGVFRAGQPTPRAWGITFRAARATSALVVQHVLLAVNAHINADLAAAAAEVGLGLSDFGRAGVILERGVDRMQERLNRTTFVLRALDVVGGRLDEMFSVYSMRAARRYAYDTARRLIVTPEGERKRIIDEADECALRIGERLLNPPLRDRLLLAALRLTERNVSPRRLLEVLEAA